MKSARDLILQLCNLCSIKEEIGSGQFGTVYKGVLQNGDEEVVVAVKTLKEGSGEDERVKFLQEAAIMGQFKHPNVVQMYGMVTSDQPVSTVITVKSSSYSVAKYKGHIN